MLKCPKNVDMAMGRVIFCFDAASFSFLGCQPWGGERKQFVLSNNKKHEIIYEQPLMGQ